LIDLDDNSCDFEFDKKKRLVGKDIRSDHWEEKLYCCGWQNSFPLCV